MPYSWTQYSIFLGAALVSSLVGASVVHNILKPDITIKLNPIKLENDKKERERETEGVKKK